MNALKTRVMRLFLHTVGQLSDGIRLTCREGLTAGKTLDYIYRNRPSGRLLIGKLIDRVYLSHAAWKAVRGRHALLKDTLQWAVQQRLEEGGECLILDIASGTAPYVQDVLSDLKGRPVRAHCWDIQERWLVEGRAAAAARGLDNIVYDRRDAMDPASYALLPRRPDVIVASGFYDWFDDDEAFRRSLAVVHDALAEGGIFVFTFQTAHASLETVNEAFDHFDGSALHMKTRPAALVHQWAKDAGFAIVRSTADASGYYEVTTAARRPLPQRHKGTKNS